MSVISGRDLLKWGLPEGPVYSAVLAVANANNMNKKKVSKAVKTLKEDPSKLIGDPTWSKAASAIIDQSEPKEIAINQIPCDIKMFGADLIEPQAIEQMQNACLIPVAVKAALMPDAHKGYGIPIGGVLALDNSVSPYSVGVDIGCRMQLSVFDMNSSYIKGMHDKLCNILMESSVFGVGCESPKGTSHEVLDDPSFDAVPLFNRHNFRDLAIRQVGTSGAGNHFVEFGIIKMEDGIERVALLSHSGSRGFGSKIASFYSDLAMSICKLPKALRHLAWLNLDTDEGKEYWEAMSLAGRYAKANHDIIHMNVAKALKEKPIFQLDHHHNFAWREKLPDGRDVIVHRKGATPAADGEMGIIPGSMATECYVVKGKGNPDSLSSSSHGAGRAMSRKQAKETFTKSAMKAFLEERGVTLIGGSIDESPMAYKDVTKVIERQKELVDIVGVFNPKIVRMSEQDGED